MVVVGNREIWLGESIEIDIATILVVDPELKRNPRSKRERFARADLSKAVLSKSLAAAGTLKLFGRNAANDAISREDES